MNVIPVKDLKPDCSFSEPVTIDGKYIILVPETPLSALMLKHLVEWEFREVFTEGKLIEKDEEIIDLADAQANKDASSASPGAELITRIKKFYDEFTTFVENLYNTYVTKNELKANEINNRIKNLVDITNENRRVILRVVAGTSLSTNYLVAHTARSTVLAIVLGSFLKVQPHRLIELGVACVLHEIGMVRLPPQIYMVNRPLNPQERKSILAHPILGYNLLKEKQFPLPICMAALEHHERINGSGYPRALNGEQISMYAKIIAVACSYDAVTASRPYKEAKDGYAGMVDILKNEGKQYDDTVIKALVFSLSIYPIGTYVLLTSGKKAQVVDVNTDNPRFPIVQILGAKSPEGKDIILTTSETGVRILRPMSNSEITNK